MSTHKTDSELDMMILKSKIELLECIDGIIVKHGPASDAFMQKCLEARRHYIEMIFKYTQNLANYGDDGERVLVGG